MNEQTEQTAEVSLEDMSLADYRTMRETGAEPKPAETPDESTEDAVDAPADGEESLGEDAAEEGAAEESTESDQASKPAADDKKPAKKGGWQRKLDKAEREIEALKQQLAAKPAETAAPAKKDEPVAAKTPQFDKAKPKIDDFDSIEQYTEALTDWKLEEKEFKLEQTKRETAQRAESERLISAWKDRVAEAKTEHADYDSVMEKAKEIPVSPAHQHLLLKSEHGAEIAYDLASDHAELKKFAAMSPLEAARYFGKLEAAYEGSGKTPKQETKVSNAPKPIRPIGSRSGGSASFDLSKASLSDYRKARESGKLR